MGDTTIEWTGKTWNPVTGCTKVSPGCDHCYAETITERFHGKGSFAKVTLHNDRLRTPFTWRKPQLVFVNSMADLFHKDVPDEFIAQMWAVMAATPQHTYQILTKRHGRMRSLIGHHTFIPAIDEAHGRLTAKQSLIASQQPWPVPNVQLGVLVEDQKHADLRIPVLRETPSAVRFISAEPLLRPVEIDSQGIDWVIVGGESGRHARPCDPDWIRRIVSDCRETGVPVFVKQLGSVWARDKDTDKKGGNPQHWPEDLRIRQFPTASASTKVMS